MILILISVIWILVCLLFLKRFKMNVVYVILFSIMFGALRHQFGLV